VAAHQCCASLDKTIKLLELAECQRAMDVAASIVEAELRHFVVPWIGRAPGCEGEFTALEGFRLSHHPMIAQAHRRSGEVVPVCRDDAPLASGDDFDRMQREDSHVRVGAASNWLLRRA